MSDDEVAAFFVAIAIAFTGVIFVLTPLLVVRLVREWWGRWVMVLSAIAAIAGLLWVLLHWAAKDVRADWKYIGLFLTGGLAVQTVLFLLTPLMGISWRDDALERRNPAAVWSVCGVVVGGTLIYTGGNIGEGETIWMTIGPAAVGITAWLLLWMLMEEISSFSESVSVERDCASGLRYGAALVATGLIVGRAIAGDWVSTDEFVRSLARGGWPAVMLGLVACLLHFLLRPRVGKHRSVWIEGVLPGSVLLSLAAVWVALLGRW